MMGRIPCDLYRLSRRSRSACRLRTDVSGEAAKVLTMPDIRAALAAQGLEPRGGTPEQFGDHIKAEIAEITKIAKAAGVKAE
jgi:tripartite-type tricarboxylate transporter receptor subunit TctC